MLLPEAGLSIAPAETPSRPGYFLTADSVAEITAPITRHDGNIASKRMMHCCVKESQEYLVLQQMVLAMLVDYTC